MRDQAVEPPPHKKRNSRSAVEQWAGTLDRLVATRFLGDDAFRVVAGKGYGAREVFYSRITRVAQI